MLFCATQYRKSEGKVWAALQEDLVRKHPRLERCGTSLRVVSCVCNVWAAVADAVEEAKVAALGEHKGREGESAKVCACGEWNTVKRINMRG